VVVAGLRQRQKLRGVAGLPDDLEAGAFQQAVGTSGCWPP